MPDPTDRKDVTQTTRRAYAVTPSDSAVLEPPARALYIGGAGTLRVVHIDDTVVTNYSTTVAGFIYPFAVKQVHSAGTTATNIVALL